ncbi:unnamed protein product, partial [Symbiodinium pilosum]
MTSIRRRLGAGEYRRKLCRVLRPWEGGQLDTWRCRCSTTKPRNRAFVLATMQPPPATWACVQLALPTASEQR